MAKGHAPFDQRFIWWAHFIAIAGGFNLGAHLAWFIGMNRPLPMDFLIWVQAHGHLQFLGWTGLYIMGVSLYFLPRLLATPLPDPRIQSRILRLMVIGMFLVIPGLFVRFHTKGILTRLSDLIAVTGEGFLTLGVFYYCFTLIRLYRSPSGQRTSGVRQMKPFMATMLFGWLVYAGFYIYAVTRTVILHQFWLDPSMDRWLVDVFLYLVLIPVTLAFSYRTFPLYLGIPPAPDIIIPLGYVYGVTSLLTQVLSHPHLELMGNLAGLTHGVSIVRLVVIFLFIMLLRLWKKWPTHKERKMMINEEKMEEARRLYRKMHDFGRAEWLLYGAYGWLTLAVIADGLQQLNYFITVPTIPRDPVRHLYLLGFVTTLIFGMAQRMLPGFMGRRKIAYPRLVLWTGVLVAVATTLRVVPLSLPVGFLEKYPGLTRTFLIGFGQSGWIMLLAVGLLWFNLYRTSRANRR